MINFIIGLLVGGTVGMLTTAVVAGTKRPSEVVDEETEPARQDGFKHWTHVETSTGTEFWQALLPDLRKACGPAVYPFLSNEAWCTGRLDGDTLTVYARDELCFEAIGEIRAFKGLEAAATAKAGRPIKVMILYTKGTMDDEDS